jgi:hypothetical protein
VRLNAGPEANDRIACIRKQGWARWPCTRYLLVGGRGPKGGAVGLEAWTPRARWRGARVRGERRAVCAGRPGGGTRRGSGLRPPAPPIVPWRLRRGHSFGVGGAAPRRHHVAAMDLGGCSAPLPRPAREAPRNAQPRLGAAWRASPAAHARAGPGHRKPPGWGGFGGLEVSLETVGRDAGLQPQPHRSVARLSPTPGPLTTRETP